MVLHVARESAWPFSMEGQFEVGAKAFLKERLIALQLIIFPSSNHSC